MKNPVLKLHGGYLIPKLKRFFMQTPHDSALGDFQKRCCSLMRLPTVSFPPTARARRATGVDAKPASPHPHQCKCNEDFDTTPLIPEHTVELGVTLPEPVATGDNADPHTRHLPPA